MQHESVPDKKRKIDTINTCISSEMLENALGYFMFLQIIGEYPFNYMVKIDPVQDKIIYEDLLRFEKSMTPIEMNNHELESLYAPDTGLRVTPMIPPRNSLAVGGVATCTVVSPQ